MSNDELIQLFQEILTGSLSSLGFEFCSLVNAIKTHPKWHDAVSMRIRPSEEDIDAGTQSSGETLDGDGPRIEITLKGRNIGSGWLTVYECPHTAQFLLLGMSDNRKPLSPKQCLKLLSRGVVRLESTSLIPQIPEQSEDFFSRDCDDLAKQGDLIAKEDIAALDRVSDRATAVYETMLRAARQLTTTKNNVEYRDRLRRELDLVTSGLSLARAALTLSCEEHRNAHSAVLWRAVHSVRWRTDDDKRRREEYFQNVADELIGLLDED